MSITLAIPTFNRTDLLFECFKDLIDDDRVSEIVIVDDASEIEIYNQVAEYCSHIPKVKLYRNEKNLDCYRNKREAVSKASNEWVILLDSDNIIDTRYLDTLYFIKEYGTFEIQNGRKWIKGKIHQPQYARPSFDFRRWSGANFTKSNLKTALSDSSFTTMLNACNFFINRDEYLRVWDGSVDPVTSDSIYFNYKWLEAGNSIYVVPGLEYEHRVHNGSHYQNNVMRTPKGFHESIIQKLKELR